MSNTREIKSTFEKSSLNNEIKKQKNGFLIQDENLINEEKRRTSINYLTIKPTLEKKISKKYQKNYKIDNVDDLDKVINSNSALGNNKRKTSTSFYKFDDLNDESDFTCNTLTSNKNEKLILNTKKRHINNFELDIRDYENDSEIHDINFTSTFDQKNMFSDSYLFTNKFKSTISDKTKKLSNQMMISPNEYQDLSSGNLNFSSSNSINNLTFIENDFSLHNDLSLVQPKSFSIDIKKLSHNKTKKKINLNLLDVFFALVKDFNPENSTFKVKNESLIHEEFKINVLHHIKKIMCVHTHLNDLLLRINGLKKKKTYYRDKIYEIKTKHMSIGCQLDSLRHLCKKEKKKSESLNFIYDSLIKLKKDIETASVNDENKTFDVSDSLVISNLMSIKDIINKNWCITNKLMPLIKNSNYQV